MADSLTLAQSMDTDKQMTCPESLQKISHKGDSIAFMTTERQAADAKTGIRLRSGMAVLNINSLIINRIV